MNKPIIDTSCTLLFGLSVVLAACSEPDTQSREPLGDDRISGETVSERLEEAAEQSDPEAAEVLDDAADEAEGRERMEPFSNPLRVSAVRARLIATRGTGGPGFAFQQVQTRT